MKILSSMVCESAVIHSKMHLKVNSKQKKINKKIDKLSLKSLS